MGFGFRLRVGSLLNVAFVALAAVLTIALGLQVISALQGARQAGRLVTLAEADRTVFNAMQALRASRGDATTDFLNLDDPRAKLNEIRQSQTAQFQGVIDLLPQVGGAGLDRLTTDLGQHWAVALQQWDALAIAAAQPKAARVTAQTDTWSKSLGMVVDDLNAASLNVAAEARVADPFVGELVSVRQAAWTIRDVIGRECTESRGAVASGKKLSIEGRRTVDGLRTLAEAGWATLNGLLVRPGLAAALGQTTSAADAAVRTALADRDAIYRKLDDSGTAPVTPAQWTERCVSPFDSILKIANTALDLTRHRAEDERAGARLALLLCGGALVLALVVVAFVLRQIRRRVVNPVRILSDAIHHLSHRDFERPVPQVGAEDEFAEMAATLERLREGALGADRLAAERLGAQEVELARGAKVGTLCRGFEASVGRTLDAVEQATGRMMAAAETMTGTAGDATRRTGEIARAVEHAAESFASHH